MTCINSRGSVKEVETVFSAGAFGIPRTDNRTKSHLCNYPLTGLVWYIIPGGHETGKEVAHASPREGHAASSAQERHQTKSGTGEKISKPGCPTRIAQGIRPRRYTPPKARKQNPRALEKSVDHHAKPNLPTG